MSATRHRANPLMLLPGLLLVIVGVLVMLVGAAWAVQTMLGLADRTRNSATWVPGPTRGKTLGRRSTASPPSSSGRRS